MARLGSSMSVLSFAKLGSSLSLRSLARLGSNLALFGCARFGSTVSVLDNLSLGSSLSVRGFVRLGSSLSLVGKLRVPDSIYFLTSNTYLADDGTDLKMYVKGTKAMTVESDGGILHGSWSVESNLVTSDRRLKKEIAPLQRTLRNIIPVPAEEAKERRAKATDQLSSGVAVAAADKSTDGALWMLRQLRPVSYSFRKGAESKYMRFGFIADELESVVPQVVRKVGSSDLEDQKAVVYQDLIALLAAASQSQQAALEQQQAALEAQTQRLETQQQRVESQQQQLDMQRNAIEELLRVQNQTVEELKRLREEEKDKKKGKALGNLRLRRQKKQQRT